MIEARPSNRQEQQNRHADVEGAVEEVGDTLVVEEAEQVDVPLIGVREAVEQDHAERQLVQIEQHRAAGFLVEIFQPSDQHEIAQQVEEPLREIAHQLPERDLALALLEQLLAVEGEIHGG